MYKPSTYLLNYLFSLPMYLYMRPSFLPIYLCMRPSFLPNWLPRWNNILTQLRVHPQVSNNGHPVDGALVGAGSLWPLSFRICYRSELTRGLWSQARQGDIKLVGVQSNPYRVITGFQWMVYMWLGPLPYWPNHEQPPR
jgi:hypothetical protein